MDIIQLLGIIGGVTMPLWNIPLIMRIVKRKSSEDISLWWALGVWACIVIMAPAGFVSVDIVLKMFSIVNLVLFSGVAVTVIIYRKKS
ncbi:MAG: hypothetical protein AB1650_02555 [Candidatus Omnitrophota bacterium]